MKKKDTGERIMNNIEGRVMNDKELLDKHFEDLRKEHEQMIQEEHKEEGMTLSELEAKIYRLVLRIEQLEEKNGWTNVRVGGKTDRVKEDD
jgi:hypothetical protein